MRLGANCNSGSCSCTSAFQKKFSLFVAGLEDFGISEDACESYKKSEGTIQGVGGQSVFSLLKVHGCPTSSGRDCAARTASLGWECLA